MSSPRYLGFDTMTLHAGQQPDPATGSRATPIYQTASYVFDDSDHASSVFNIGRTGHVYSRISNPTVAVVEERMAALEGGVGAVATASGMAAIHLAITTLAASGNHIVASRALYGGTQNLLAYTLPRFGIETTFVDPRDLGGFAQAIRPNTRLVLGETIGNPGGEILDIPALSVLTHEKNIPLLVDATLSTPSLIKPFEHGADIVVHSLTKFIGGHGVAVGGVVIDSGRFDWEKGENFPQLTQPYAGFHDISFTEDFGAAAFITRARVEGLRDFGAALSPANAFYILQGLETLPLRMRQHVANATTIAEYLVSHDAVKEVTYAGLPAHQDHALGQRLMPHGCGAVFSFDIKGGLNAGRKFIDTLELFSHLANVGDAKSLVIHPASTTHHRMDKDALARAGITDGLIRLSIGLEEAQDLIDDLGRALHRSQK
jgi:O-acetylhomoserine (thiol)-lyase